MKFFKIKKIKFWIIYLRIILIIIKYIELFKFKLVWSSMELECINNNNIDVKKSRRTIIGRASTLKISFKLRTAIIQSFFSSNLILIAFWGQIIFLNIVKTFKLWSSIYFENQSFLVLVMSKTINQNLKIFCITKLINLDINIKLAIQCRK